MVAADAAMESKRESESRVKAAAWAWYQRSGGSVTPSAGRSEAFAVRCALRHSTSRFQREAASHSRATLASAMSDSALTRSSSLDNSSFLSHRAASFGDVHATDYPDKRSSLDCITSLDRQISDSDDCDADHNFSSLDLIALHSTACWDCGSSLFDTFELVAMSKKLDAELHEPNIDSEVLSPQDLHPASSLVLGVDTHKCLKQPQVLYLQDKPYNPTTPPGLSDDYDASDTHDAYDKLVSAPDKQSKQAVYDMFCRFGDVSKHVVKQANKRSPANIPCAEACRKPKPRHGRMSLHGLAKAIHHIRHPSSHNGVEASQDHHHHHHYPHSPHHHQGKAFSTSVHTGASRLGDHFLYDDAIDKGQRKERHIHHHHHHHYHYLFHSDDEFQLQSLDKSLMVAAAGLRSPKVNPALSSYLESPTRAELGMDYGRKWADLGSIPPPSTGCNI